MPYRRIRLNVTFKFSITLFAPLRLAAIVSANNTMYQVFPAWNLQVVFDSSFCLLAVPPSQPSSSKYLTLSASLGGTDASSPRLVAVHLDATPDPSCFPLTSPKPSSHSTALKRRVNQIMFLLLLKPFGRFPLLLGKIQTFSWTTTPCTIWLLLTCPCSLMSFTFAYTSLQSASQTKGLFHPWSVAFVASIA